MGSHAEPIRPHCPHCGQPIGVYEPVWWLAPHVGAERTSLLRLARVLGPAESLWHAACAEGDGVDGG